MDKLTAKQKKWLAAAIIALYVALTAALCTFAGDPLLRYAREPELFREWVAEQGAWSAVIYVAAMFLTVVAAVIPGEPMEICGGYAFGAVWGTVLCLLATALASAAIFAMVRHWGVALVEVFFSREKIQSLRFLHSSPQRNLLMWIIFTVPGTPKDLLCYVAGLTDLHWRHWMAMCTLGRIPSVITSTVGGDAVGMENYRFAIWVFAITLALSGIGWCIYRRIARKQESRE